ncbi:MAG TPA: formate dehydrogenase accessory sulfurtransferase FdhD [Candidatus Limnocylindrales bacterium]|nr:formate dehydrogenase accessory sulfurtransferase FdhD [Candidatus Limnocylindrales bacterium]
MRPRRTDDITSALEPAAGAQPVRLRRLEHGRATDDADEVVSEEPLEIQLGPVSLAVVMRTPGHDEELALGFLVTERIVAKPEDIYSIRHCTAVVSPEAQDNIIRATLAPHVSVDLTLLRRNLYASSSCGICGKATIENVMAVAPPLTDETVFDPEVLASMPPRLRERQAIFARTGGLHAAGLFDTAGNLLVVREDIGRHNAVDKVIGWALRNARMPLAGHALMVSGRISYEVVQKALAARIPVIAAVSAPSSLAVALAEASGMALVGFLRGQAMNVYANTSRIRQRST